LASLGTAAGQNSAIAHYQSAITLDPAFARAYAGMAITYLSMAGAADRAEKMNQAKLLAEKAERINPLVAEAHTVLGVIAIRDEWNAARGEAELRRALELDPNNAANHAYLAELLADEGHADEALHQVDVARTSDPLWPYINAIDTFVSGAAHQYDRGVDAARRNVAMAPNSSRAHDQLAWSLFDAGRYEESIAEWRATAVIDKDKARVALEDRGLAEFRRGGATAYAAVRVSAIEEHPEATTSHPHDFVPEEWYAFVGDRDHAIAALQQTIDRHDPSALDLAVNPMLDNLHRDPRFLSLLSRVGLSLPSVDAPATITRASLTN
jgi:tetratricopeptide (TPR) repeat protein